jgi:hypothetical protein
MYPFQVVMLEKSKSYAKGLSLRKDARDRKGWGNR